MTPLDRDATTAAHHADLHRQRQAAENDLRSQTRAVHELTAQLEQARRTIAAQDALIRQHDTLLGRLRDLDEQRDRAWADYDMAADFRHLAADPGSPAGRAQDTADRLAAEARDYQWTNGRKG